jgi:xanthine dehydrogenase accessory factor
MESPAICGGVMDIFIERMPDPRFNRAQYQALVDAIARREPVALSTVVAAPTAYTHLVAGKVLFRPKREPIGSLGLEELDSHTHSVGLRALHSRQHRLDCYAQTDEQTDVPRTRAGLSGDTGPDMVDYANGGFWIFTEVQRRQPCLVIVGAGHIAQPLAQLGCLAGFTVTVLDDRSQFANRQRFPGVADVVAGPMHETLRSLPLDRDTYVVLITRGHQHDVECLLAILELPLAYLGMIGSRRRVRGVFELLEEERGIPPEKLRRVFAPIGLDIGAKTPAELALAIMAEVIMAYRGGTGASISETWRNPGRTAQ